MQMADGVRAAVAAVDREVVRLGKLPAAEGLEGLRSSWSSLVDLLALGPEPELRFCPHCGSVGMRAATRCGTCWHALVPPPAALAEPGTV